jgi:hypothetical protein
MAIKINMEELKVTLAKSVSGNPTSALVRPPWASIQVSQAFGASELFFNVTPDGEILGESNIVTETPGEVNIVIRRHDMAIAFVRKYRNQVLPKTEANIAWRNEGKLDILDAPNLGLDTLEITRGWTYKAGSPWKVMTEGQEETGVVVEEVTLIGQIYANTGKISTWADVSFGIATDKPYGREVDEIEKVEIKKVLWLTPEEVQDYIGSKSDSESCGFTLAALNKFRIYAKKSQDPFLNELAARI